MKKNKIAIVMIAFASLSFAIPSFPGAGGFGGQASGGRGGRVIYVTNLNSSGPGSFEAAVQSVGPAYILFKVSGLIDGCVHVKKGDKTIAGQTSPGGVLSRGFQFLYNEEYDPNTDIDSKNMIIRHIRSRYADDAARVIQTSNVILDHCSFGWADDECLQVSNTTNLTVQNCILAETRGSHARFGGTLIVYGNEHYPLDSITYSRNLFMRLGGRLPEFNCYLSSWCNGHNFKVEWANNLYWDPGAFMEFKNTGGETTLPGGIVQYSFNLNLVNNYYVVRPSFDQGMVSNMVLGNTSSNLFLSGNAMTKWPGYFDYNLVNCCTGFHIPFNPSVGDTAANRITNRHPYPEIAYMPVESLREHMIVHAGARPIARDSIDRRYIDYLQRNVIDSSVSRENSADFGDALLIDPAPAAPSDADSDGMPDYWELANGLDPNVQDHNGMELSMQYTGIEGYTNLECYLNRLSDSLVNGVSTVVSAIEGRENENRTLATMISVFPNPFNPVVTIAVGLNEGTVPLRIMIYDLTGRMITDLSENIRNGSCMWNAEGQASGMYVVKIACKGSITTKRILLTK